MQNSDYLPSFEELTVPELPFSTTTFLAAGVHLGIYCDFQCKEFMLCREEERDPRKCINEGKEVTRCGFEFFRKVKKNCYDEFTEFSKCLDRNLKHDISHFKFCRETQNKFSGCMLSKMNIEKPPVGYFCEARYHNSSRPPPPPEKTYQRPPDIDWDKVPMPKDDSAKKFYR